MGLLTDIKFKAFLDECVAASSGLIVLLQNKNLLSLFGQTRSCGHAPDATANDDGIQALRDPLIAEAYMVNGTELN